MIMNLKGISDAENVEKCILIGKGPYNNLLDLFDI